MIGFFKEPRKLPELLGSRGSSTAINPSQTEPIGSTVPWADKRETAEVTPSRGNQSRAEILNF